MFLVYTKSSDKLKMSLPVEDVKMVEEMGDGRCWINNTRCVEESFEEILRQLPNNWSPLKETKEKKTATLELSEGESIMLMNT